MLEQSARHDGLLLAPDGPEVRVAVHGRPLAPGGPEQVIPVRPQLPAAEQVAQPALLGLDNNMFGEFSQVANARRIGRRKKLHNVAKLNLSGTAQNTEHN